jgi:hypothetical protein
MGLFFHRARAKPRAREALAHAWVPEAHPAAFVF